MGARPQTSARPLSSYGFRAGLWLSTGTSLGPDAVIRCIADAVGYFAGAPVRTYVMLLVERRAAAQLLEMRRATIDVNRPNKVPTVAPTSTSPG